MSGYRMQNWQKGGCGGWLILIGIILAVLLVVGVFANKIYVPFIILTVLVVIALLGWRRVRRGGGLKAMRAPRANGNQREQTVERLPGEED